ncbi:TPA: hypothetical protein ACH3X2_006095 [Trebouxia sp. C0005]|nr:MAG: hypothetical protein FRX49_07801 [Trebouxia sp. A1-2]
MTAAQTQETTLWELAGADPNCVFSPFVWRVRLALYYKGQSYKSVPWRYTEKDLIKPSEKVPVLDFQGKRHYESWDICQFLDKQFPEKQLFKTNCPSGDAGILFIVKWADNAMYMGITLVILMDMYNHLAEKDKKYFRESREALFKGQKLEDVCADTPAKVEAFRKEMEPLRQTLKTNQFLGGSTPNYADIAVAGNFLWSRSISKVQLLARDDPIYEWRERMFQEFDGTIKNSFGYPV